MRGGGHGLGTRRGPGRPRRTGEKAAPCAARRGRSGDRQCAERRRSAENAGGVPAGAARRSRVPSAGPSSLAHARHRNPHPSAKGEEPVLLSGALILLLRTAESASGWRPRHRTPRRTVRAKGERTPGHAFPPPPLLPCSTNACGICSGPGPVLSAGRRGECPHRACGPVQEVDELTNIESGPRGH